MTNDQIIIFSIMGLALVLFAWGRWRYDLVAMSSLVICVLAGLVPVEQAFLGFGHPAVITVAAVLVISHALKNSGLVDAITARLANFGSSTIAHVAMMTLVVAVASAFMNNVGALALMLPVALSSAAQHNRSPAILLMPLAFGSILGGMTTMIGTPPNVIIAMYRQEITGEAFSMFDFSPVGLIAVVGGLAFIILFGWRLIPSQRRAQNNPSQLFDVDEYLMEISVPENSKLIGKSLEEIEALDNDGIDVIGMAHGRGRAKPTENGYKLRKNDVLLVKADPVHIKTIADEFGLKVLSTATDAFNQLVDDDRIITEAIVAKNSPLEKRGIEYLRRRTGRTVALMAIARQGKLLRRRLRRQIFKAGDILLLQADAESIHEQMRLLGLFPLANRDLSVHLPPKKWFALAIFASALGLGITGLVPMTIAFILAIAAYVASDMLPTRELYRQIDWPVIVLLAAMIPVGGALETTGATNLVASSIVNMTDGMSAVFVLTLVLVITMFLSDVINNAATVLVMAPIGVSIANSLGVNIDTFLMAVAVGASCAFLTPIGHQSNTLVMGPGGYHFGDYWRMGLPLEIIIVTLSIPGLLWVFPL